MPSGWNTSRNPFFAAFYHSLNVDLMVKILFGGQKRFHRAHQRKRLNPHGFFLLTAFEPQGNLAVFLRYGFGAFHRQALKLRGGVLQQRSILRQFNAAVSF